MEHALSWPHTLHHDNYYVCVGETDHLIQILEAIKNMKVEAKSV